MNRPHISTKLNKQEAVNNETELVAQCFYRLNVFEISIDVPHCCLDNSLIQGY